MILHTSLQVTKAKYKSEFEHTKDTPYLTLMGELWGVFCEDFEENWLLYNWYCTVCKYSMAVPKGIFRCYFKVTTDTPYLALLAIYAVPIVSIV